MSPEKKIMINLSRGRSIVILEKLKCITRLVKKDMRNLLKMPKGGCRMMDMCRRIPEI